MPRLLAPERAYLARDGMLAGVTFAMGALLTLAFPTAREFDQSTASLPIGAYSAAYLEILVKANPHDWPARLAFVRQLQGRGDDARALSELDAIPKTDANRGELDALALQLSWAEVNALPAGSPARRQATGDFARRLQDLAGAGANPDRAEAYADLALQVERPLLAAEFFRQLGQATGGEDRASALARAGRWSLAGGDPAHATTYFDLAAGATTNAASRSVWVRQSLIAAEATGDVKMAAERALRWIALLPQDLGLLGEAARLALAANRPGLARDLGRRLVRATPADSQERERQALRELAAGDPEAAWPLVEEAVRRHPASYEWKEREAKTAEWTGRPRIALRDWVWLSRSPGRRAQGRAGLRD